MIYTIKEGRHYSTSWVGMLWRAIIGWTTKDFIQARVSFSDECLTPAPEKEDINKLFGLDMGFDHHQNSVRVGWRANGARIGLFAYEYKDGARTCYHLFDVWPDREYYIGIFAKYGEPVTYIVRNRYGQVLVNFDTVHHHVTKLKHKLYPYFGGSHPAPATMKIKVEWVYNNKTWDILSALSRFFLPEGGISTTPTTG